MTDPDPRNDSFLRRAKDVINLIIVGVLGWVAVTVQDSTKQIAVLQVIVQELKEQVAEAKGTAADRYTSTAAIADFRSRDAQISQNVSRLDDHEKRLRELEMDRRKP